jgi:hypothetical protein
MLHFNLERAQYKQKKYTTYSKIQGFAPLQNNFFLEKIERSFITSL